LRDFRVDLGTTERLAQRLWKAAEATGSSRPLLVAESGIYTSTDVQRLADCGASAILVGESLMRRADIGAAVRELMSAPEAPAIS
jgi:indole-3-glycerol phosphate synthase